MTPVQRKAALRLAEAMQAGADDPMWVHYAEVKKSTLGYAAALLRELASEPQGEPVAWRYRAKSSAATEGSRWHFVLDPSYIDALSASFGAVPQPLYAHPPQRKPPPTEAEVADQETKLLNWTVVPACERTHTTAGQHLASEETATTCANIAAAIRSAE